VAPSKKEKRANLKKKRVKNHKMILNALTAVNRGITPETAIRN
jgi:hypothetical protein